MSTPVSISLETIKLGWKHKILWFLGLGAIFLTAGNEFYLAKLFKTKDVFTEFNSLAVVFKGFFENIATGWFTLLSYLILGIILIALVVWISINSQGAIIKKIGNPKIEEKEKNNLLLPQKIFWKVLGVNIISKIFLISLSSLIIFIPIWFKHSSSWSQTLIFFGIDLLLLLSFVAVVILERYLIIDLVLNNTKIKLGFKNAWQLLVKNILLNFESAIILILVVFFLGLALSLTQYLSMVVPWLLLLVFTSLKISSGVLATGVLVYVLVFSILLAFNAWLGFFYHTYWTLIFKELTQISPKIESQIIKIIRNR